MVCFSFLAALRTMPQRKIVPQKKCSIEGSTAHRTEASTARRSSASSLPVFLDMNIECNFFFWSNIGGGDVGLQLWEVVESCQKRRLVLFFVPHDFFPPKTGNDGVYEARWCPKWLDIVLGVLVHGSFGMSVCYSVWQYVALRCSVLQGVAVCCNMLQCDAMCCSVL